MEYCLLGLTRPDLLPAIKQKNYLLAFQQANSDYLIYTPGVDFWLQDIVSDPTFQRKFQSRAEIQSSTGEDYTVYGP